MAQTISSPRNVPVEGPKLFYSILPSLGVPDLDRAVPSGVHQQLAVGAERHAAEVIGVPLERDNAFAIQAICRAPNTSRMPFEREEMLAGLRVPQLQRPITAGAHNPIAIGAEGYPSDIRQRPARDEGWVLAAAAAPPAGEGPAQSSLVSFWANGVPRRLLALARERTQGRL